MKALDFVRTPKGHIAIVNETNYLGDQVSITFIGTISDFEHNAWWNADDLIVIDNLANLLAKGLAHPFGEGKPDVDEFYPVELRSQK